MFLASEYGLRSLGPVLGLCRVLARSRWARSGKVVAADEIAFRRPDRRHGLRPRLDRSRTLSQCCDERGQHCQGQDFMARFGDLIEARGKRPLLRERAVPFVAIVDETTKLPLRQFELDQRKDGIGPRLGSNESFDAGLGDSTGARATHAGLRNKLGQELGRDRVRPAQPVFQWLRQASCVGRHGIGTISWRRFRGHGLTRVSARHHKEARWTDTLRYKRFIAARSSDLPCSGSRGRARVAPLNLPGKARR
jgi:hypothetical protein